MIGICSALLLKHRFSFHEFARNVHMIVLDKKAAVKKFCLSGDQLTASIARGAKRAGGNSLSSVSL